MPVSAYTSPPVRPIMCENGRFCRYPAIFVDQYERAVPFRGPIAYRIFSTASVSAMVIGCSSAIFT